MIWLLACLQSDPLAPWPTDPQALHHHCKQQSNREMATICWVQSAAMWAQYKDPDQALTSCQQIDSQTWREECYFRVGEELAITGHLSQGLAQCSRSGHFQRNCITHALWRAPIDLGFKSTASPQQITAAFSELEATISTSLQRLPTDLQLQTIANLQAQLAHSIYVGSGIADPTPAHLPDRHGVYFRTAYAIETARILSQKNQLKAETIVDGWEKKITFQGKAQPETAFHGRYRQTIIPPEEHGIPRAFGFASSSRLIGATAPEDMLIATLEAAFWIQTTKADFFQPYLHHPKPRVQYTASRLFYHTVMEQKDRKKILKRVQEKYANHPIQWYVKQHK